MFARDALESAHKHSIRNRPVIESSEVCGCFCCISTFDAKAIVEWIAEPEGADTAICPNCSVDAVLGSKSGYPISIEFLTAMNEEWFSIAEAEDS